MKQLQRDLYRISGLGAKREVLEIGVSNKK